MDYIIQSFHERPGNTLRIGATIGWVIMMCIGAIIKYSKDHDKKK